MLSSISIALKSLVGNKVRTALTLLGVICGVASVVIVLSVSEGLKKDFQKGFEALGTNNVFVYGNYSNTLRKGVKFTLSDIDLLKARCPSAIIFSPEVGREMSMTFGRMTEDTRVTGILPEYFIVTNYKFSDGQGITRSDVEQKRNVAVLGAKVVDKFFKGRRVVGRRILINRIPFTVKGVLQSKGDYGWRGDSNVFIPMPVAQKMIGEDTFWTFEAKARNIDSVASLKDEIRLSLMRSRGYSPSEAKELLSIEDYGEWRKESQDMLRTIVIFLSVIGGMSLLIGGIGIMNIMLVSVMERIREIGVRKAVGATEFDIMIQFIIEAVTLCVLGGIIGIVLGWFGNIQLGKLPGFYKLGLTIPTCAIAFTVSMAVGLISGLWPAAKASRLNPIEALRHE